MTMFQYKIIRNILSTDVSLFNAKLCDHDTVFTERHYLKDMFYTAL